jgi:hypothetical protein
VGQYSLTNSSLYKENAERMILASFMEGLTGETGKLVRISNPQNFGQALDIAIAIQEVLRQEKSNETFYTRTDMSVQLTSRNMNTTNNSY